MSTINNTLGSLLQGYQKYTSDSQNSQQSANNGANILDTLNGSAASSNQAYVLDLSSAAQQVLASVSSGSSVQGLISITGNKLTALNNILDKYKDAPVDDNTLQSLSNDLRSAGLLPEQLAEIQQASEFNPIEVFVQLLNGGSSSYSSGNQDIFGGLGGGGSTGRPSIADQLQQYLVQNQSLSGSGDAQEIHELLQQFSGGGITA